MVRKIAGLLVVLFVASLSIAAQDKKEAKKGDYPTIIGTFESYKKEILTLKVENKEKKFDVPQDTPVAYSTGKKDDKIKTSKAKEHLKDVKKGSLVAITLESDGKKVLGVGVVVSELPPDKPKGEEEKKDK
jgi:hypothetical protein